MTPDHPLRQRDRVITLRSMMGDLSDREREILARRYGLGLAEPETLQTISDQLGISRERVRQIEKSALKKLQQLHSAGKNGA